MIELNIPGRGTIQLHNLVFDVNGTLAVDGQLYEGLPRLLNALQDRLTIYLLTADTHGKQAVINQRLNLQAVRVKQGEEAGQKAAFIRQLNANQTAAIGQGANDAAMLETAIIGIGILSDEGIAGETLASADIVVPDIYTALALFEKPLRIVATLRK